MGLIKNLVNRIHSQVDTISDSVRDDEANAKYAIEDSEKHISDLRSKIASVVTERIKRGNEMHSKEEEVQKFANAAQKAVDAGKDDNARTLLTSKQNTERELAELTKGFNELSTSEATLKHTLSVIEERVTRAKSNQTILAARQKAAKMRQEIASMDAGIDGNSALSSLDELEKRVTDDEAKAQALEEIGHSSTSAQSLVEQYETTPIHDSVEAELAALKVKK